jgi:hypothetical protein
VQLPTYVSGERLECPRRKATKEDVPSARRRTGVARRGADGGPGRNDASFRRDDRPRSREALIEGMHSGRVRARPGDRDKPSAVRSYEAALRDRIFPELGGKRLGDVQRRDVQRLGDDLLAEGRDPSTIRSATGRCGRQRCTRACAAASCWRCAGITLTSQPA